MMRSANGCRWCGWCVAGGAADVTAGIDMGDPSVIPRSLSMSTDMNTEQT
jgi:hypothetical protein